MANLDSVLKSRDITLPTEFHLVKAMVFPVVMYGCENWTVKKAEHWKIDAFELWFWRRLLRVPWTARRSNQSILREINPDYSLEGLMLKFLYFGHLTHWKRPWCWERLRVGGERDDRWWDGWMVSLTRWTWVWASLGAAVHGAAKNQTWVTEKQLEVWAVWGAESMQVSLCCKLLPSQLGE